MKRFNLFLLFVSIFWNLIPTMAFADIGGLTKCSDSPQFQKRLKASIKKLEQRKTLYEKNTPPWLAIEQQINLTKNRFEKYNKSNLLCGNEGLPHLVADGRWNHAAEFIIPGFGFLYISGWIGWVGRKYLKAISLTKNSTNSEIIINVPLALKIMTTGYIWPISAWQEYTSKQLIRPEKEITISPR